MANDPEILHTADIPEAEAEVQDALIARLTKDQQQAHGNAKTKHRRRRKKESLPKVDPVATGLTPVAIQSPRKNMLKGMGANWKEARDYAALHVFECIDFLMQVVRDPLSKTSDRITAAIEVADRGGASKQMIMQALQVNVNKSADEAPVQSNVLIIGDQKVTF